MGQTGSGKTFTMEGPNGGDEQEEGIIPRAIRDLFSELHKKQDEFHERTKISIKVQFVQIYNERVYDMLVPKN